MAPAVSSVTPGTGQGSVAKGRWDSSACLGTSLQLVPKVGVLAQSHGLVRPHVLFNTPCII